MRTGMIMRQIPKPNGNKVRRGINITTPKDIKLKLMALLTVENQLPVKRRNVN